MYASDDPVRRILQSGRDLASYGSNNWALTRAQAMVAIGAIRRQSRVLLGGDVWIAMANGLSRTGDSWFFEPNERGSHSENVKQAAEKAESYVAAYPEHIEGVTYFELVIK